MQFHECKQVNGTNPLPARRFPPPWTVEKRDACFVVRDSNGQQVAYVYFEDEPGRRSAAKLLTSQAVKREEEEDWIATSTERRYY
jgi:hypothetical protein